MGHRGRSIQAIRSSAGEIARPKELDRDVPVTEVWTVGSTLYTRKPLPPYFTVIDRLIFLCIRADPTLVQSILPPVLTTGSNGTVIAAAFHCGRGWGLEGAKIGMFAPVIREFPAPDTQESCFLSVMVGNEPALKNFGRHYAQVSTGGAEVRIDGQNVFARM